MNRCGWVSKDPLYVRYHDEEWGVPEWDDHKLFAKLILDGAQAGLSWITILRKRDNYYRLFDSLDPVKMARYDQSRIEEILCDSGIIRNRLKVEGAVRNARAYLKVMEREGSFSRYLWQCVNGAPIQNKWRLLAEIPSQTPESETMSKLLRSDGFTFVGPTICYAFMQAVGMVNDHLMDCFRHRELAAV